VTLLVTPFHQKLLDLNNTQQQRSNTTTALQQQQQSPALGVE